MTRRELLHEALRTVEKRRQAAELDALRCKEELEERVPELAQLSRQKAECGALAARLALDGQREKADEQLAQLQALAGRRALLLHQYGLGEEACTPQYHCPLCGDTGYRDGVLCVCVKQEVRRMQREAIHENGPLTLCRFENFDVAQYPEEMEGVPGSPRQTMGHILQDCMDYAADFGPHCESLLLYGDAGLGKTHLALSIAADVLDKGYDVIYVSAQSAFADVSAERFNGGSDLFASMLAADLLVLDDLGTEYLDAYLLSKLYELVNSRMHRRPTIYTTNICDDALLYQRYTEKIASRLLGACCPMRFWGHDLRLHRSGA